MNYDGIMALSDGELRVKAAELMGAKWYAYGNIRSLEFGRPAGWHEADGSESLGEGWNENILDYPNDIAAAWGIANWAFENKEWYISISQFSNGDFDVAMGSFDDTSQAIQGSRDKPGRAIVRAFILAMEG